MSINKLDLKIISFLQEKGKLDLTDSDQLFGRSANSLKRHIVNINLYLPTEKQIKILGTTVLSTLTYNDYINFMNNLSLDEYFSSQSERIFTIIVLCFLNKSLNTTRLYEEIGISLTTKKKDNRALTEYLKLRNLDMEIIPKRGIEIVGDEINFRILTTSILASMLEMDYFGKLINRKANNPLQKMITMIFSEKTKIEIRQATELLEDFIEINEMRVSYPSKKFFYIYLILSLYRIKSGILLKADEKLQLKVRTYHLLKIKDHDEKDENLFLDYLISSLDYTSYTPPPIDNQLKEVIITFIAEIQKNIITTFYSSEPVFNEVYKYIYKSIIRNKHDYHFYDNKLDDTHRELPKLFGIVSRAIPVIESKIDIQFTRQQISTLTLIFRKFIMENKIIGRNSKRIVIVTNSTVEKTSFFVENLRHYVDVTIVENININELHLLKDLDYNSIITFSNRIATLLGEENYTCIKLNFYLHPDDIEKLLGLGFSSSSRRKILSDPFLDEIANKSPSEIKKLLLQKFSSHFL
ncbi:helix-turn-helix domain-containing protein [Bacillus sp. ISL-40]|uniref:helix-turn-helix domain-containing protein n=1 Tax=unclassified Bacillus (in: firmicutes) TaxID=185979 RepID=UPI001BE72DD3|nr:MULTISPECIES: helix-turn-helix domain-containing protein [unclassified Bacillus (in: firmicutes)]MBT2698979.1 helix-turn-helix domain-containing protein [Bacillus sp. ISL-40]MBT2721059.1 helix-turn-helix domain-containing protein [Bacillus sp. ISL-46]MBT2742621.1 helix-turn-helix domain-containing protein [Bacillus sp. ISL-77]